MRRRPIDLGTHISRKALLLTVVCFTAMVWNLTGRAQVLYGTVTGMVTDSSGAAISNAKVQALDVNKGITQQAVTNSSGEYQMSTVLPGNYKFTFTAPNFATQEITNIRVDANTAQRVDTKLAVATVSQSVTVTTAPPLLQTDRADVHTVLNQAQLQTLPSVSSEGKSFQSLYKLIPGASLPSENNSSGGNPQRAMTANVNGQSSQGNNTRIDGVTDAYPWLPNNIAYVPPTDSIETVNVATNSFDAEQGQAGGAVINVQIKSGTNQFHGDAHEFHTDNALKALNYFNPPGFKVPLNIFNQYGGSLGGPIIKDKLFFFGDFELTRQVQAPSGGNPQRVPFGGLQYQNASTNGFFDFRGLQTDKNGNPVHIYDPRTGNADGTNRSPISCNGVVDELCLSAVDPAAVTMAKLIPAPNQSGVSNNYLDTQKGFFHRNDVDSKVTYVPNETNTVFGRYSYSSSDIFDPPALSAAGGNATLGGQNGNSFSRIQIVGLGLTHTFSPNLLLDANGGFTRQRINAEDVDIGSPFGLKTLNIPGTNDPSNQLYWGIPAFQFVNFSNLGNANTGNPFVFRDNQYVGNANLTWVKGHHQLRFGIEFDHTQMNHFQPQGGSFQTARGSFRFTGAGAEQVTCSSTGSCTANDPPASLQSASYADFLLGLPDEVGKGVQNIDPIALRWSQWAAYARDQWQVTPKLSLDYGMRWEYYPMAYSDHGRGARVLDPTTMTVLIGGAGGVPVDDGVKVGYGLFLPRLGIAYSATPSTVLRLGYGISADSNNWRFLRNAYPSDTISDWTGQSTGGSTDYNQFSPAASLTGLNAVGPYTNLPIGITLIPIANTSSGKIPLPKGVGTTTVPLNFRRGYIHTYNATLEQEFAGFVADIGYVGSRAIRPLTNININAAPAGGGQTGRQLNAKFGNSWSDIGSLMPFGNNYYDALQTRLTRRLGGESQIGFVYTWSKTIDYEDDEEINFILRPYPAYLPFNRAVAGFDRTHNFEAYMVYELPFGKGKRWATNGIPNVLAGGWKLGSVLSIMSGTPFTVTDSNASALNAPGNTQTPDLVGPIKILRGSPQQNPSNCQNLSCRYFDTTSFAHVSTPGVLGDSPRSVIRGPKYFDLDASLYRNFKITERVTFQLEADAFGVTNTPHMNNPTSDINNSDFGKITSTLTTTNAGLGGSGGERQWWFGGKVIF